jgi:stage II sporulation protein D
MTAQVLGSRGSTTVSGSALRARLGLYDTWAYFKTVTSRAARPQPADPTGGAVGPALSSVRYALRGSVLGAARGATLRVQVRSGGRWVTAGATRAGRGGAYAWATARAGTYRVVSGSAPGPAIHLG